LDIVVFLVYRVKRFEFAHRRRKSMTHEQMIDMAVRTAPESVHPGYQKILSRASDRIPRLRADVHAAAQGRQQEDGVGSR
jgi:hypothetical protein